MSLNHRSRKFGWKHIVVSNLATLILASILTGAVVSAAFTAYNLYLDALPHTATYTIEVDGLGEYRAIRYDGQEVYDGTNSTYTIQSALDQVTSGGIVFVKAGDYVDASVNVAGNAILLFDSGVSNVSYTTSGNGVAFKTGDFHIGASAPSSPSNGQPWYDTSGATYNLKIYNGTDWATVAGAQGAQGAQGLGGLGSYSYIAYVNGSNYQARNSTGALLYSSTNASYVITSSLDSVTSGGEVFMKEGTYTLTSDIIYPSGEGVNLRGAGKGTIIDVGTNKKWIKFAPTGNHKRGIIEGLYFDGKSATNVKALDSSDLSGTSQVMDMFEFSWLFFNDFDGSGSLPMDLKNFERGSIHNFDTIGLMSDAGRILFSTDASAGNVQIYDFFMSSAGQTNVGIIKTISGGALHIFDGHFHSLDSSKLGIALDIFATGDDVDRIWMHDCRGEYMQMLRANVSASENIEGGLFHDNNFRDDHASAVGVDLIANVKGYNFHDNTLKFPNGIPFRDNITSYANAIVDWNRFTDNRVWGTPSYSSRTYVKGNFGYEVGVITNYRIDTTKLGRGSSSTPPVSPFTMTVYGGEFYVNITGSGLTINIQTNGAVNITGMTGLSSFSGWLKAGMKINVAYSSVTIKAYQRG